MRKRKILILFLVIIVVFPIVTIQLKKLIFANRVSHYLIEEKGYKKEEIRSVEGIWGMKMPAYYVIVFFENEPTIEYTYFVHSGIGQFSYRSIDGKPVTVDQLKNYDPS